MVHDSLVTIKNPNSLISESYRMFRTNLSYINIDDDNKVIMFTSASPKEGKTTSACNAAVTLASMEKKILLVECDLRKPNIHRLFGINQEPGLTNCLIKKISHKEAINQIQEQPNLFILPAGVIPPNPTELLASTAFEKLIEEMRNIFDFILIDAPPILATADPIVISRVTDGVVLVIATNETKKEDVKKSRIMLEKVGAHILGGLLTKADGGSMKKYNMYYNFYQIPDKE